MIDRVYLVIFLSKIPSLIKGVRYKGMGFFLARFSLSK